MRLLVIFTALLAFLNLSHAPIYGKEAAPQKGPWLKGHFINNKFNYEIDYPAQWEKKDAPPLDVILFAPIKPGQLHSNATMNIISEKIGTDVTLDKMYSESVKNLSAELKELHIEGSGDAQLNGIPTKWILYTHVMQSLKYTVLQYFIYSGETFNLITFSSPSETFSEFRSDFENIASSFRLLSKAPEEKSTEKSTQ
jgi:hypothetical protein